MRGVECKIGKEERGKGARTRGYRGCMEETVEGRECCQYTHRVKIHRLFRCTASNFNPDGNVK